MAGPKYAAPHGGRPPQTQLLTGRSVFTEAYVVIPKGVMQDIVTSAHGTPGNASGPSSAVNR